MHISEGILPTSSLVGGLALALPGLYLGFRDLTPEKVPQTALFTSGFFVASLVHVPIGPTSTHLILNGLLGICLGWKAFCAIFVALILQAILFQFGGLTTLGVNTCTMAWPAILAYYLCHRWIDTKHQKRASMISGAVAFFSVLSSGVLTAAFLKTAGQGFWPAATMLLYAHIPVALTEAVVTSACVGAILRLRPEVFSL